ncbi:PEGA domain-containing protein [Treponema sp. HNW]|uniref:PEGA domain-containing protein n=1 Tax=Treponema sp. HNW TaxID=3116654 RepID=UPI003D0C33FC
MEKKSRHSSSRVILDIRSAVSAADVYINNVHKGSTPLVIEDMLPGYYKLRIEKKGFYTEYAEYLFESAQVYKIVAELRQITGSLHIRVNEPEAALYINGTKNGPPILCFYLGAGPKVDSPEDGCRWHVNLPEGKHEITIKKFGKKTAVSKVYISGETQVYLDFYLEDADFELTSFSADKKRFNPYNPGDSGICRFTCSVTAAGEGLLEVYGEANEPVYRLVLEPFKSENIGFSWNGRDEKGRVPESGTYRAVLKARGSGEGDFFTERTEEIVIDRSLFIPLAFFSAGGLSSGFVPSARLMPKKNLYSACTAGADFSLQEGFKTAPLFFGFVSSPLDFLELSCTAGTEIREGRTSPFIVQGALKAAGKTGIFRYGALLGGSYSSAYPGGMFNEGVLHAGILTGAGKDSLYAGVSEQVYFGNEDGSLYPFGGFLKTGFACTFQQNFYALHVSAALRSPFRQTGIEAFGSLHTGIEVCICIPKTPYMPAAGIYYTRNRKKENGLAFRIGAALYH